MLHVQLPLKDFTSVCVMEQNKLYFPVAHGKYTKSLHNIFSDYVRYETARAMIAIHNNINANYAIFVIDNIDIVSKNELVFEITLGYMCEHRLGCVVTNMQYGRVMSK